VRTAPPRAGRRGSAGDTSHSSRTFRFQLGEGVPNGVAQSEVVGGEGLRAQRGEAFDAILLELGEIEQSAPYGASLIRGERALTGRDGAEPGDGVRHRGRRVGTGRVGARRLGGDRAHGSSLAVASPRPIVSLHPANDIGRSRHRCAVDVLNLHIRGALGAEDGTEWWDVAQL
jgi:hypothetical protein